MTSPTKSDRDFWAWVATLLVFNNRRNHELIADWLEKRWKADWRSLDFQDLRGTTELWLEQALPDLERAWFDVQNTTVSFMDDFLFARAMQHGDVPIPPLNVWTDRPSFADDTIAAPALDRQRVIGSLVTTGPGTVFSLIPGPETRAMEAGRKASYGTAVAEAMNGGQDLVAAVAERHPTLVKGWQRVTDADPCPFCSLLAARGAVFKDLARIAATSAKWDSVSAKLSDDNGARVHANCRCTLIPVYRNGGEDLTGWAEVADKMWFGKLDGYFKDKAKYRGNNLLNYFAREFNRYKKAHPDVSDGEAALRRKVEQVFGSNKYVKARERAVIRAALSKS